MLEAGNPLPRRNFWCPTQTVTTFVSVPADYITPCSRTDPNFNQCALEHGRETIPKILKGEYTCLPGGLSSSGFPNRILYTSLVSHKPTTHHGPPPTQQTHQAPQFNTIRAFCNSTGHAARPHAVLSNLLSPQSS